MGGRNKEQDNTKLINSIRDEEYKKEILKNGYCVGLLVDCVVEERIIVDLFGVRTISMAFRLNESLILDRHTRRNRLIHHLRVIVYIDISINEVEIITISAVSKKHKDLPIGVSFQSSGVDITAGKIFWHRLNTSGWEENKWADDIWIRIDLENNIGEIYCGIHENLKSILYLVS
ncbi:hypothetical protein [Clostridium sp.]|uniref:hypothetical protein n=1 Tax=Clostridium sp. TaxID=1506 RepID=UPI003D6C94AF